MLAIQDSISIPIAYIETFVMTFVAFCIGYAGAIIYARTKSKRASKMHENEILKLNNTIKRLQRDLDARINTVLQKDRTNKDLEQIKFQRRAFSEEVLEEKSSSENKLTINFERIGKASPAQRDELQQISGIGPYTETKLNDLGIYTFEQISKFNDEDIITVTRLIKFFPDRIKNDRWVEKAKTLSESVVNDLGKGAQLKKI